MSAAAGGAGFASGMGERLRQGAENALLFGIGGIGIAVVFGLASLGWPPGNLGRANGTRARRSESPSR